MDLELKFEEIAGYEPAGDLVVTHEESMETAIPEYCPDLARVVDTVGQIRLREKNQADGRVSVSGAIRVTVLYTSEESAGLHSLTLSVPFSCTVEDGRDCQVICVEGRLLLLEAKVLGARKLYVRVLPEFRIKGYRQFTRHLCTGVREDAALQIRQDSVTVPVLRDLLEREFTFAQEVPPESGQTASEDLLMDRVFLQVTGCQHFGNKLVVKGDAALSILYRADGQRLCCRDITLPFSQIIDCEDLPEEAVFSATAQILEQEIHPVRTEAGSGFGVTMRIGLLIGVYERRQVSYIADLYSTKFELAASLQPLTLPTSEPPKEQRCFAAQQLEGAGPFVYLTDVDISQPELTTEGDCPLARATVRMRVLYLDDSGAPVTAERSCEVSTEVRENPSAVQATAEPESWQRVGSGYEMRLPVAFRLLQSGQTEITAVASVQQQGEMDRAAQPSLILRRLGSGETLWEVAKQCHTERQAIMSANGLENEADAEGILLLIPKTR